MWGNDQDRRYHFVSAVPFVELVEVGVGPGVASDLVPLTIHPPDDFVPAIFGIINWTFGFVDTSGSVSGKYILLHIGM